MTTNLYVQAVEAIYARGLESELMPEALAATSRLPGAIDATLEVIDKATQRSVEFYSAACRRLRADDISTNSQRSTRALPLFSRNERAK